MSRIRCLTCLAGFALCLPGGVSAQAEEKPAAPPLVREIYVPFEELSVLLDSGPQRVFLTRQEYADLLEKAKQKKPDEPAPQGAVILSAEYTGVIEDERVRISGVLEVEILADGVQALPLELAGVGVRSARWEPNQAAAIGLNDKGQAVLFAEGRGTRRLTLDMVTPLQTTAARQTLTFQVPTPAATRLQLTVPGNVELKAGAQVIRRAVDAAAAVTRFTLLPPHGPTSLVMSLNNRIQKQQRVVVARSVIVDEVTTAYERLHTTVSFDVLHGAADRFRFDLPDGFEPTEVLGPLVARWLVEKNADKRTLEVRLREPTTGKVVLNLSATRTTVDPAARKQRLQAWTMPLLTAQDVAGQVAVVGLIVEDRLKAQALDYQNLIPIDNAVLTTALPDTVFRAEPGAPRVVPIAAYYAPQAAYQLQARFPEPEGKLRVTTNVLLVLNEREQRVHGGFVLSPETEKRFAVGFSVPREWQVTQVTTLDGHKLAVERYDDPQAESRIRVQLPKGVAPGETVSLLFEAVCVPQGWLGQWDDKAVVFPKFLVEQADADEGALAVRAEDDFGVRPDVLDQVTPLDENEKEKYGLKGVASTLAYRYDAQAYQATLIVQRTTPTLSARCFSFLHLAPEGLAAHYEILYHVQQARVRQLALVLPLDTPKSLEIVGLDGATVKKFTSEDVAEGRRWTAFLSEAVSGDVRLALNFQQALPDRDHEGLALPLVRAPADVTQQSAVVAVEGSADLDIDVHTEARKLDVGELVAAQYRVGRRLLGTFGFVGAPKKVTADIHRRPGHALPPALVQRAELVTAVSPHGVSQTAARYELCTKALFLEVKLPERSKLWSVRLDRTPVAPQRDRGSLLLSLAASTKNATRDLQIVYETDVWPVNLLGSIESSPPVLLLRADRDGAASEVPTADLVWHLIVPKGYRLVRSGGTVYTEQVVQRRTPLVNLAQMMYDLSGGVFEGGSNWKSMSVQVASAKRDDAKSAAAAFTRSVVGEPDFGVTDSLHGVPLEVPSEEYSDDSRVFQEGGGMGGGGMGGGMGGYGGMPGSGSGPMGMGPGSAGPGPGVAPAPGTSGFGARGSTKGRVARGDKSGGAAVVSAPRYAPPATGPQPSLKPTEPKAAAAAKEERAIAGGDGRKLRLSDMDGERTRTPQLAAGGSATAPMEKTPAPSGGAETAAPADPFGDSSSAPPTATPPNAPPARPGLQPVPTNQPGDAPIAAGTVQLPTLPQQTPPVGDKFWALEGVRSLPIDLDVPGERVTFQSLGVEPRLQVTLANQSRLTSLAWGVALLVVLVGLLLTPRNARAKAKYVIGVALVALVVPLVTGWVNELGDTFDFAFYAACCLLPYYLLVAVSTKAWGRCCSRDRLRSGAAATQAAVVLLLVAASCLGAAAAAEPTPPAPTLDPAVLAELLEATKPVKLPEDAVIIPYDAESGVDGVKKAEKVLVPHAKYVELWNRAFPDKRLDVKPPVVPFSLAGAEFRTTLTNAEFLLLEGHVEVDVFSDKEVQVPLRLSGGVLSSATLGGKAARLQFVQPAPQPAAQQAQQLQQPAQVAANAAPQQVPQPDPAFALLHLSGKGRQRLEVAIRFTLERRGGWRVVSGQVPTAPATLLAITVPAARTELRLTGLADRDNFETSADNQRIETALLSTGAFRLQWRPKVAEGQVDRSLTVNSQAVLDVQEDGLRLVWQLGLEFPRGRRDAFTVWIPADYLVEKVVGDNVRGWDVKPDEKRQRLEVTLLKETPDREALTVHLSRRGSIAPGAETKIEAPTVSVEGAMLHRGRLTVRRSPLLSLRTGTIEGLARTDVPAETTDKAEKIVESPLGLRSFQAYEFNAAKFTLPLVVAPIVSETTAKVETVLRIAERETSLESRVMLNVQGRPVHRVRLVIPQTWKADRVSAPGDFTWSVTDEPGRKLLCIYLAGGQLQPFSVLIAGSLGRRQDPVVAPNLEVLDVARQQGDLVVQVDPAFDVRAAAPQRCEPILLDQVYGWLKAEQRTLARLAFRYQEPNYQLKLEVTPRRPRVSGYTVTNVKVTDVAIEETIILDLMIHEAGIREVSFRLPAALAKARVNAPMLRQKSITDDPNHPGWKRFRLELQDQVIGQYRVLVENDRLLPTADKAKADDNDESPLQEAPIPVLGESERAELNVRVDQRYVTTESAGSDEVVVSEPLQGLTQLGRQQSEWRKLAAILGEGITTAYLVNSDAQSPKLEFKTKQRKTVQTAGAQIGLAETLLVLDANGAYRGQQIYHVNNTTEQFLVVKLPDGARLWTATVSGAPVKPTEVPGGQTPDQVRIPLIKTAEGDRDYPVVLKFGGQLANRPRVLGQVAFPLPRTVNIKVDLSQVQLRLPSTQRWWYFDGTMRQILNQGQYQAGFFEYNTKQAERLRQVLDSGNLYAKVRADNNLKQLGLALHNFRGANSSTPLSAELQKNIDANTLVVEQAQQQSKQSLEILESTQANRTYDNRGKLNDFFQGQSNGLARNVVQGLGGNFDAPPTDESRPQADKQSFDFKWLDQNKLQNPKQGQEQQVNERFNSRQPQQQKGGKAGQLKGAEERQSLVKGMVDQQKPTKDKDKMADEPPKAQVLNNPRSQQELAKQYQQQLEAEVAPQQGGQGQAQNDFGAQLRQTGQPLADGTSNTWAALPNLHAANSPDNQFNRAATLDSNQAGNVTGVPGAPTVRLNNGQTNYVAGSPWLSLDVDLPERGQAYFFTTPGGDITLTAQAVSSALVDRLLRLLALVATVLLLGIAYRLARSCESRVGRSLPVLVLLLVVAVASMVANIFPFAGCVLFVVCVVRLITSAIRRRRRVASPAAG